MSPTVSVLCFRISSHNAVLPYPSLVAHQTLCDRVDLSSPSQPMFSVRNQTASAQRSLQGGRQRVQKYRQSLGWLAQDFAAAIGEVQEVGAPEPSSRARLDSFSVVPAGGDILLQLK